MSPKSKAPNDESPMSAPQSKGMTISAPQSKVMGMTTTTSKVPKSIGAEPPSIAPQIKGMGSPMTSEPSLNPSPEETERPVMENPSDETDVPTSAPLESIQPAQEGKPHG